MNRYITNDLRVQYIERTLFLTSSIDQLTEKAYRTLDLDMELLDEFKVKKYMYNEFLKIIKKLISHPDFDYVDGNLYCLCSDLSRRFCYYQKNAYKTYHDENDWYDLRDGIQDPLYDLLYEFIDTHKLSP
jgi:hypothetical protein